jgi:hypothetical protein
MASFKSALTPDLIEFIRQQPVFFTASTTGSGRINLSPKGIDTFRVLGETRVCYLDYIGSGNETAAHLQHDGRLTIMFCSFGAKPLILRLYGKGKVIRPNTPAFTELEGLFELKTGVRQIIAMDVDSLQTSCGFGVPEMTFVRHRETLNQWCEKKGPEALVEYERTKNRKSIDGLTIAE